MISRRTVLSCLLGCVIQATSAFAGDGDSEPAATAAPPGADATAEAKENTFAESLEEAGAELEEFRKALPFDLHAGALIWYYQPFEDEVKNNVELYAAWITLDAEFGDFGFHFEPRFRDTELRPFFTSNVWAQEVYASWDIPEIDIGTLKAGKIYSQFGKFWDGTFFGNIPYFDGMKLDPDAGLSLENRLEDLTENVDLDYSLQFFVVDGSTNGSLQDRDTLSIDGARERNSAVARVAPVIELCEDTRLTVGGSGQHFEADFDGASDDDTVSRAAAEVQLDWGPVTVFGEYTKQWGHHVLDFPVPGDPSDDNRYVWAGGEYRCLDWLLFRYSYSEGDYDEVGVREWIHQPSAVLTFNKHFALMIEYDYWQRREDGDTSKVDNSINFVIDVHF